MQEHRGPRPSQRAQGQPRDARGPPQAPARAVAARRGAAAGKAPAWTARVWPAGRRAVVASRRGDPQVRIQDGPHEEEELREVGLLAAAGRGGGPPVGLLGGEGLGRAADELAAPDARQRACGAAVRAERRHHVLEGLARQALAIVGRGQEYAPELVDLGGREAGELHGLPLQGQLLPVDHLAHRAHELQELREAEGAVAGAICPAPADPADDVHKLRAKLWVRGQAWGRGHHKAHKLRVVDVAGAVDVKGLEGLPHRIELLRGIALAVAELPAHGLDGLHRLAHEDAQGDMLPQAKVLGRRLLHARPPAQHGTAASHTVERLRGLRRWQEAKAEDVGPVEGRTDAPQPLVA
mmetsp:Transcript_123075/g.383146  ORF Transcript_123075/g.383146 Transcript_123075/m.383146 type:complete len:352 (+) Transcript_123075:204-1259(+)